MFSYTQLKDWLQSLTDNKSVLRSHRLCSQIDIQDLNPVLPFTTYVICANYLTSAALISHQQNADNNSTYFMKWLWAVNERKFVEEICRSLKTTYDMWSLPNKCLHILKLSCCLNFIFKLRPLTDIKMAFGRKIIISN